MRAGLIRSLLAGVLALFLPTAASAQTAPEEPPAVLVFLEDAEGPLAYRMRAELVAMGLRVELRREAPNVPTSLEDAARSAKTVIGIRVASRAAGVDMTILDRVTGKTVHRTLSVPPQGEAPAAELVVLRTVELLRASLMEIDAPHPPRGDVAAKPEVRALIPSKPRNGEGRVVLGAGFMGWFAASSAPGTDLGLSLDWIDIGDSPFGIRAAIQFPLATARVTSAAGFANTSDTSVRLSGLLRLGPCCSRVSVVLGVGMSVDILSLEGVATMPYTGRVVRGTAASPILESSVGVRIFRGLALRADGSVGCLLPNSLVRFPTHDVDNWACPVGTAGAALAVGFP